MASVLGPDPHHRCVCMSKETLDSSIWPKRHKLSERKSDYK